MTLALALVLALSDDWGLEQMITRADGRAIVHARSLDPELQNPWPAELEAEFQARAQAVIEAQTRDERTGVNTYFENEKRSYGFLMAQVLGGNARALEHLQAEDHQHAVWHRETAGIDYYACFTLKHQIRKYFYFGALLEPAYRARMLEGARSWTSRDPLRRPHYAYEGPKQGWGPDARNSWVDVRSTENLYLMRTTSVYLMAEEASNAATAALYKRALLDYTATLYRVGIGEWDSENYHGHSIAPLLNLYDFAADREVRAAAKACLDFYAAAGAVKYWRGGFNGPTKRDYNHAQPFGGSAANMLWMWFGDHPSGKRTHWESDEVHAITSAYRPPLAVVRLARRELELPLEIFAAKPPYTATTEHRADAEREYAETQYLAPTYALGSLSGGTSTDGGDVCGFKLLVYDEEQGAVSLQAAPTGDPRYPGSPMYRQGVVSAPNRVAQQENLALWLIEDGDSPWLWVIPEEVRVEVSSGVTFLECDRTWVAVRPLGTTPLEPDVARSAELLEAGGSLAGQNVLSARGLGGAYCGLAVEVGDASSHGSPSAFRTAVLQAELDLSELQSGVARYRASDGKWLGLHWNDDPLELGIWRNGQRRDLRATPLYQSEAIAADWGGGVLEVRAGGAHFRCAVDEAGRASFGP